MEEDKDKKPNYKIWHFGKTRWDRIVDERFYAENDGKAYDRLQMWNNSSHIGPFYYSHICYSSCVDDHGNHSPEFDIEDNKTRMLWHNKNMSWWKKVWEEVSFFFTYYFVTRPKDFYYWVRDLVYLLKNKEAYSNQWNLDWHLLDSIERNVPSLIENSCALAFIDEAILKMHGNEPGFDLDKYHRDNYAGYPKDIEELAMKIQKEEYSNLLLYVKLYKYYSSFGDVDFNNQEEVEFDKQWRYTLPIKKGTYDEISDYAKALSLSKEYWGKIWDWMKLHGQKLND